MTRHWLAALALLITAAAWGATFTLIKNVLTSIAPEPFISFRFALAGVILLAIAASLRRLRGAQIRPGIILGFFVFAGYWLQTRGLLVISPSRSAFLTGLYVVLVPFCDKLLYGVRISTGAWAGSILAVIGTAALIGGFDAKPTWGDAFTLGCAVMFALHVVLSARYSTRHSAMGLAAIQVMFVGLAAAPLTLFSPRPVMTPSVIGVIVFTAVVTTALAFAALMWGQRHVSATEAAVILSFEPVAASITSIVWYDEPITLSFVVGSTLILAAMIASQLRVGRSVTMPNDGSHSGHE